MSLNDMSVEFLVLSQGPAAADRRAIDLRPAARHAPAADVVKKRLADDAKSRARIEQRKASLSKRHDDLRARQREAARKGWDDKPITPARLVSEVWDAVKNKNWLLAVRNQASFPEGIWEFSGAGQYLGHNGGGGVGYGPGAAVGAAIANRDTGRFCVSLLGDGDFVMAAGAIWSAVHYRAPMLMIINNNTTWGNDEKHQMHVAEDRKRPVENAWIGQRMVDPDIDHAMTARSFGAWSAGPITDPAELAGVLKQAVAEVEKGAVAVLDVRTNWCAGAAGVAEIVNSARTPKDRPAHALQESAAMGPLLLKVAAVRVPSLRPRPRSQPADRQDRYGIAGCARHCEATCRRSGRSPPPAG